MCNNKHILGFFKTLPGYYGANIYQKRVMEALAHKYDVRLFSVYPKKGRGKRFRTLKNIIEIQQREKDITCWIRTYYSIIALNFSRIKGINIGLLYHLDSSHIPHPALGKIFDYLCLRNLKKCNKIVTIADYWKYYLMNNGITNIETIQYGIDNAITEISDEEIKRFRLKYKLESNIPLIYLGNCQRRKGVVQAYEALKNEPYLLVTSGKPEVNLPIPNLDLNFREYLTLLKASSVVLTMSLFLEGWNITAHEAMLCGTPVVGSGSGGMRELLEGGDQIICEDFSSLRIAIKRALDYNITIGKRGKNYAKRLNHKRFKSKWLRLVHNILLNHTCASHCKRD